MLASKDTSACAIHRVIRSFRGFSNAVDLLFRIPGCRGRMILDAQLSENLLEELLDREAYGAGREEDEQIGGRGRRSPEVEPQEVNDP